MTKREQLTPIDVKVLRLCAGHVLDPQNISEQDLLASAQKLIDRGLVVNKSENSDGLACVATPAGEALARELAKSPLP